MRDKTVCQNCFHVMPKREADLKIGAWLSAALEDPSTCQSMKDDINEWFECTPLMEVSKRKWARLTDKEIEDISDRIKGDELLVETSTWHVRYARALERKLKEKNT